MTSPAHPRLRQPLPPPDARQRRPRFRDRAVGRRRGRGEAEPLGERATAQDIATTLAEMKALRVSTRQAGRLRDRRGFHAGLRGPALRQAADACRRTRAAPGAGRPHARAGARRSSWPRTARACGTRPRPARLTMRPFTDAFLDAYLARAGEAVCASVGAYQLEGLGAHLFTRIEGDYFTVLGLPLLPLLAFLAEPRHRPGESGMSPYETLLAEARWPALRRHRRLAGRAFALAGAARLLAEAARHRRPLRPPAGRAQARGARRAGRFPKRTPNARGCNLTLPHKIDIMPLLDRIDPMAEHIGAVNTVIKQADGSLEGRNSDGFGFLAALQQGAPGWQAAAGPVVVLGAGGAARAVVATPGGRRRARAAPGQPHAEERDRSRRRLHAQRRTAHRHRALGRARRTRSTARPCWSTRPRSA